MISILIQQTDGSVGRRKLWVFREEIAILARQEDRKPTFLLAACPGEAHKFHCCNTTTCILKE